MEISWILHFRYIQFKSWYFNSDWFYYLAAIVSPKDEPNDKEIFGYIWINYDVDWSLDSLAYRVQDSCTCGSLFYIISKKQNTSGTLLSIERIE